VGSLDHLLPVLQKQHALSSLSCLIKHLGVLREPALLGRFAVTVGDLSQNMRLDLASVRALSLFPPTHAPQSGQDAGADTGSGPQSLFALLNKCRTPMGARLLKLWLLQPLTDAAAINARLDCVELLTRDARLRGALQTYKYITMKKVYEGM
jgi:DNA mismatch repair protein MSH2